MRAGHGAVACLALTAPVAQAQDPPSLNPMDSVVQVRSSQGGMTSRQGSGVVVAPGRVVTNAHVIGEGSSVSVLALGVGLPARVLVLDPVRDLCLLDVPGLTRPPVRILPPGQRSTGIRVRAIGFPAHALSVTRGTLTGVWQTSLGPMPTTEAPMAPG